MKVGTGIAVAGIALALAVACVAIFAPDAAHSMAPVAVFGCLAFIAYLGMRD